MNFSDLKGFKEEKLNECRLKAIKGLASKARKDALEMITRSGSGHPGGALSSIDIYTILWLCADVDPDNPCCSTRDRIIVSHGHTAAGVYSVLGNTGFFDIKYALGGFRKEGSMFEGHPSLKVPGIEWCSGSLGQGLSVGCGYALAAKMKKQDYCVFVAMGDGEQGKGQIQEAREFAVKYGLNNLTAVIDFNGLQASGSIMQVMPQNICEKYKASGWRVIQVDGHDYNELYEALRSCYKKSEMPTMILANTVMGKGVSFIENNYEYHGKVLTQQQLEQAVNGLGCEGDLGEIKASCSKLNRDDNTISGEDKNPVECKVKPGTPIVYETDKLVDCRSAFGEALYDIAVVNAANDGVHIAALDCDLAESVKVQKFGSRFPENFIECGIQEHNAATVAGALSRSGILTFYADFGVFGIDETYGQHRMGDLNNTSLKLICPHNGLDVGEDGKTHQCIDYIGIMSNLFGYKLIIPADANHTDRIIRYVAANPGNFTVAMGRSKIPVLGDEDNRIMFDRDYGFEYGKADWIRRGREGTVITCGTMVYRAVRAQEKLKEKGMDIGVLNLSCPLELDVDKIREAASTGLIVTYEDHNVRTGIGSIIGTFLAENGIKCNFRRLGIARYGVSASPDYQYKLQSLDEDSLIEAVVREINKK